MKHPLAASTVAMLACALWACSKRSGEMSGPGAEATTAAAQIGLPEISEAELPHPKAGQWEIIDSEQRVVTRYCQNNRPLDISKVRRNCQKVSLHRTPAGGVAVDSECAFPGGSYRLHATFAGDFQDAYSTDMQMAITLPGQSSRESDTRMQYRYLGPCPPAEQAAGGSADGGE